MYPELVAFDEKYYKELVSYRKKYPSVAEAIVRNKSPCRKGADEKICAEMREIEQNVVDGAREYLGGAE